MSFDAGKSLYASPHRRALAGNVGKPAEDREQTVLTPPELVEQLLALAGKTLGVDVATTPENPLGALRFYTGRPFDFDGEDDGLEQSWACGLGRMFWCNPPFLYLGDFMAKARAEEQRGARGYLLGPTRPHRAWFARGLPDSEEYLQLAPFAFVGSRSAFPAPLFLAAYGGLPLPEKLYITSPTGRSRKNIALDVWTARKRP